MDPRRVDFPKLVARASCPSFDENREMYDVLPCLTHSRQSSQSTTSDSSPVTPTYFPRIHQKTQNLNSVCALVAPNPDQVDLPALARKPLPALPGVAEEPVERESQYGGCRASNSFGMSPERLSHFSSDDATRLTVAEMVCDPWTRQNVCDTHSAIYYSAPTEYDLCDGFFSDSELDTGHLAKRRRSGDSAFDNFATKLVARFPSLSRRNRERKRITISMAEEDDGFSPTSPQLSRSVSRSSFRLPSRSSSRAKSFRRSRSRDVEASQVVAQQTSPQIDTIAEDDFTDVLESPMDSFYHEHATHHSRDTPPRAVTPLLPPLMSEPQETTHLPSPLQSPAVAAHSTVTVGMQMVVEKTNLPGMISAPLAAMPCSSAAPIQRPRAATLAVAPQTLPLAISDFEDQWADRLGHNNYQIYPEPYLPEKYTWESCQRLLSDWHLARSEYAEHRARTSLHFGQTSKTYRLTEEKWAEIDALWKKFSETAALAAVEKGESPAGLLAQEPAPVAMIPPIDISGEGKFPRLGDDDIVGPMTQEAPKLQRKPSKRAQFLKMLGGLKSPANLLNRSVSGA